MRNKFSLLLIALLVLAMTAVFMPKKASAIASF